jgi:hypothetical protein
MCHRLCAPLGRIVSPSPAMWMEGIQTRSEAGQTFWGRRSTDDGVTIPCDVCITHFPIFQINGNVADLELLVLSNYKLVSSHWHWKSYLESMVSISDFGIGICPETCFT